MKTFKSFCIALVKIYRWFISPIFFSLGVRCRFSPTCSEYAIEAVDRHGLRGILLSMNRLSRCQPLCKGGLDPVPPSQTSSKPGAKAGMQECCHG